MTTTGKAGPAGAVTVTRVGRASWILRVRGSLEHETVSALREAFGDAVRCEATDVVVDLGSITTVSPDGAATLAAMADDMRRWNRVLWIAATWPDGKGHTLRPIQEPPPAGLIGIASALDDALEEVPFPLPGARTLSQAGTPGPAGPATPTPAHGLVWGASTGGSDR
jgi:anti-anti-sigma regulatory factor